MIRRLARFLKDEPGATAIEYALIAALVAVAAVAALDAMGDSLIDIFNLVRNELANAAATT